MISNLQFLQPMLFVIMEYLLCFFTIFLCLPLLILMKTWRKSKTKSSTRNLPPGPWKLPIIGNIHQFVSFQLPHHRIQNLTKRHGPVMHLQLGKLSTVVISSPEFAEKVMKTHDLSFASRPMFLVARIMAYNSRGLIFSPYGEYWKQLRKICTSELLSPKRVQSFQSIREQEVDCLIRSITLSVGKPVNVKRMIVSLSYSILSRSAFGNAIDQKDDFTRIILKVASAIDGLSIADMFPSIEILGIISGITSKLQKLHREVDAIIEDIIQEHRERNKCKNIEEEEEDLVDVLLNLQESSKLETPLTTEDIKAIIMDIFLAGTETTSTIIEWTMSEMVKHPMVMKKAQEEVRRVLDGRNKIDKTSMQDLTYMNCVIKETLRLHPPGPLLPREARDEVEICGYKIPKKTQVVVNVWGIGRDPCCWTEPERFNPERFLNSSIDYKGTNFELIPFGAGRRICPGMLFGMSVVELVIANLLYHFEWMVPNGMKPEDLDMSEAFGSSVRRRNELCLIPTLHVCQSK